jgi:glycosyltransferase involved in cell wall biosynthesis
LIEQGELAAATSPVDLVYAWMQPYQTAFAARTLAAQLGVPWVAELGDPWAFDEMVLYPTRLHRRADQARMGAVLGSASAVIMSTPEAARRVALAFPILAPRVSSLPFGFNADDFERPAAPVQPTSHAYRIVHTGTLHTEAGRRRGPIAVLGGAAPGVDILPRSHVFLLEAVQRIVDEQPELGSRVEVHLAGALSAADQIVAAQHSFVRLHGFLPHRQVLNLLRSADLLFLPMHDLPPESRAGLIPGKTYEYLASGRPILAAVPDGDARDLLAQFGRASLCRPKDVDAMRETIQRMLEEKEQPVGMTARDDVGLQALERRAITAELARLFDRVVTSSPSGEAAIQGAAA